MKEGIWFGIIKWYFHSLDWLSQLLHTLMDHQIRQHFVREAIGWQCLWRLCHSAAHTGSRNGTHTVCMHMHTHTHSQRCRDTKEFTCTSAERQTQKDRHAMLCNNHSPTLCLFLKIVYIITYKWGVCGSGGGASRTLITCFVDRSPACPWTEPQIASDGCSLDGSSLPSVCEKAKCSLFITFTRMCKKIQLFMKTSESYLYQQL